MVIVANNKAIVSDKSIVVIDKSIAILDGFWFMNACGFAIVVSLIIENTDPV